MTPRRPRGRPRLPTQTQVLSVRVSQALYDHLCRRAIQRGTSLSAYVRTTWRAFLRTLA